MTAPRLNATYYAGDLRADLIAAAVQAVAAQGTDALSLRGLARQLGVSHAAPANHFPSKRALFAGIAQDGFTRLEDALRAVPSGEPRARILDLGLCYVTFAVDNPGHFAVMFQPHLYDVDALDGADRDALAVLAAAVGHAQHAGWRPDIDTDRITTLLWASVHGVASLAAAGQPRLAHPQDWARLLALLLSD